MPATQSAHGVITVHAPAASEPAPAPSFAPNVAALTSHAISTGPAPEPFEQHNTSDAPAADAAPNEEVESQ